MVKYCKSCGSEIDEGSVFCDECGAKVNMSSSSGNSVFDSYNIEMMDGEDIIRHSQIHEGCLIVPGVVVGIGLFIGFVIVFRALFVGVYVNPALAFFCFFNMITIVGIVWLLVRYIAYSSRPYLDKQEGVR